LDSITAAASLLAAARGGAALPGLPEALRPTTVPQVEAIQAATLEALGAEVGGWKIGRHGGEVFSAPIPAGLVLAAPVSGALPMPEARFIELELAIRFTQDVAPERMAALRPADLPGLAERAVLMELVQPRYAPGAETTPLERLADCMANHGAVALATPGAWEVEALDSPPLTRLTQDGVVIATHDGPHVAAPLAPLIEAWILRLVREGRGLRAGDVLTFGSLSGMPAIPAAGARYLGEIAGLAPLEIAVAPVS